MRVAVGGWDNDINFRVCGHCDGAARAELEGLRCRCVFGDAGGGWEEAEGFVEDGAGEAVEHFARLVS